MRAEEPKIGMKIKRLLAYPAPSPFNGPLTVTKVFPSGMFECEELGVLQPSCKYTPVEEEFEKGELILVRNTTGEPWEERVFVVTHQGKHICENALFEGSISSWKFAKKKEATERINIDGDLFDVPLQLVSHFRELLKDAGVEKLNP